MSNHLTRLTTCAVTATTMFFGTTMVKAQETEKSIPVDVELSIDAYSKYVWRGALLTDDPVLQPSLTLSSKGLSLNIWSSIDMTDVNEGNNGDDWRAQELDFTVSYDISPTEGLNLGAGLTHYTFPGVRFGGDDAEDTTEIYGTISTDVISYLTPSLTVYYDYDEVQGFYVSAGLETSYALTESLELGVSASIGWGDEEYNEAYFGLTANALNDLTVGALLTYTVNDYLSVGLSMNYARLIGNLDDEVPDPGQFFGGINMTLSY